MTSTIKINSSRVQLGNMKNQAYQFSNGINVYVSNVTCPRHIYIDIDIYI